MKEVLIEKFAKVIIETGVALQEGQMLVINAPLEAATLVKYITKEAYLKNSKKVMVNFSDAEVNKQEKNKRWVRDLIKEAEIVKTSNNIGLYFEVGSY